MSSLYKRATPSQARILRIVEGAVKNAADAHPDQIELSPRFRRSIAKRAAGTLTACWPEVLAAAVQSPSKTGATDKQDSVRQRSSYLSAANGRSAAQLQKRAPLRRLQTQLFTQMKRWRRDESDDYVRAMIDVLRMIDKLKTI